MRNLSKKTIGFLLMIVLCFSLIPVSAMATEIVETPDLSEQVTDEPIEIPDTAEPDFGSTWLEVDDQSTAPNLSVAPEYVKVVEKPLVQVVYHYYDESQGVADFADYAITSTHSYYALATATDTGIAIAANKYPNNVAVSTEALRFRVLLNGSEDITAQASYDTETGLLIPPPEFMGHQITVEWYCPSSEITELPIKVTVCTNRQGEFTTAVTDAILPSNANSVAVPIAESGGLVVSQNGIDLTSDSYSVENGNLTIQAAALGGDISVSAYAPPAKKGKSTDFTQAVHTRSSDQIYYGYYTSYYTANGNVAFCLNPNVSGLNAGTYDVSGFLKRGEHDLLIKCAYYLYGGPGYDSVKNNLFGDPDSLESYGLCHAAASYVYLNDPSAFRGLSSSTINHLQNVIASVDAQPMPPEGFDVFLYNVGSTTNQGLMSWSYTPTGSLEIQKVSADPAKTNGNPCYSLAGAVFGVYNGSDTKIGTITTDASGKSRLADIATGQTGLYIVEETSPLGYAAHTGKIPFEIVSGQTTTVEVKNKPQGDPITILLKKQDSNTNTNSAQGQASLAGAQFTIKYYMGHFSKSELTGKTPTRTWVLKTDEDGFAMLLPQSLVAGSDPLYYASNGTTPTIPLGTVSIQETKAPSGYLLNSELFVRQVTTSGRMEAVNTYNVPIVPDQIIRGGVSIEKWDAELNRKSNSQGDASLVGAVFEIYNRNNSSVVVSGKTYAPNAVVHIMTTDATGTAATANNLLPYGSYEVVEKTPPTGYLGTGVIRQSFEIRQNGVIVSLKTSDKVIKNNIIRGGVEIEKWDVERNQPKAKQGDATLAGVVFEIWNRNKNSVIVGGKEYAPNTVVHTMTTNEDGFARSANNLLPYGSYEIVEKTPPTGYLGTGVIKQAFEIRQNGVIVSLKTSDTVIKNNIIRGGVKVEKWDNEIDKHKPQGGATLAGAVFEIVNRSADKVLVQDTLYDVGAVVYTMRTDKTGTAATENDLLPYGTYEVRETNPPEGYLATGVLSRIFTIREHGKIVELNTSETAIKNNPIRGDLKGVKISDSNAHRLAGVPFKITSKTTDESHTILTDQNGEFNTASSWNPHSQNTNRGETDRDGIWFGEIETLNDDLGALLYDTYLIEEQPCAANKDRELLSFEVAVYRHNVTIDLGTLTNDYVQKLEIFTTARDQETTTGSAHVSDQTTILDTVYYAGLVVGIDYTVKGVLMDKSLNAPLLVDGKEITAEKTFKALSETGSVTMEFAFDSNVLAGASIVVFESLEYEGKVIASHADIEDEGQTVAFKAPKISTNASGLIGEKELDILGDVTIIDVVSFENLIVDQTYTLKGVLMDKATGEPLLIDGQPVTAEKTFIVKAENGTVEMSFTVNSALLKGKDIVIFETLEYKEREIAAHADIEDNNQTVRFKNPQIKTSAAGVDGKKELSPSKAATIVDVVKYEGLAVGKTYTVKGMLMDKESGEPLIVEDKKVVAETTFVAKDTAGSVEVVFTLGAIDLAGKSVVVFETLYYEGVEIAAHADIEDEEQTVTFKIPKIGTTAKAEDGSKTISVAEAAKVIDTVNYENLTIGEEYTIKGVLMDKKTSKALLVDGKEVTAEKTFVAKTESGNVDIAFAFNTKTLQEKTLVVFETLEHEGKEIATHADINDDAQTVGVGVEIPPQQPSAEPSPEPGISKGAQTGREGLPMVALMIAIVAAVSGAVMLLVHKRKIRK